MKMYISYKYGIGFTKCTILVLSYLIRSTIEQTGQSPTICAFGKSDAATSRSYVKSIYVKKRP